MSLTALFLASIILKDLGTMCSTSSEEFAVEAIANSYSLNNLMAIVRPTQGLYLMPSQYDARLITIIREVNNTLSIRVQVPTQTEEIIEKRTSLAATTNRVVKSDMVSFVSGWYISCQGKNCIFNHPQMTVTSATIGTSSEFSIDFINPLPECDSTCGGVCLSTLTESQCINSALRRDLNIILRYSNLSTGLDELVNNSRPNIREIRIQDIEPAIDPYFDWQRIVKEELNFLQNKSVINLSEGDISSISLLAQRGQAGNYRIVFNPVSGNWDYYDRVPGAAPTTQKDCRIYSYEMKTQEDIEAEQKAQRFFYLVPVILGLTAVLLFIILLIIARATTNRKKNLKTSHHSKQDEAR